MKKFILISLVFMLFLSSFTLASNFSARLISYDSLIKQGEEASFRIQINNEINGQQTFSVRFPNSDWTAFTDPLSDYTFSIPSNGNKILNVKISPRLAFVTGPYAVPILIRSENNEPIQLNLPVQLYKDESREYVPIVNHEIDINYDNDPRENIILFVSLENLNNRNISELNIEIISKLLQDHRVIELGPLEKKSEQFTFSLDPLLIPQEDSVEVKMWAVHDGITYEWTKKLPFRITSYYELLEDKSEKSSFLRKDVSLELKNDANIAKTYEIPIKISFFKGIFSSYEPKYSYKLSSGEGRFLVWNINLEPQEEIVINVKTSYRALALLLLLLIILVIAYYIFRPPIKVKKEVSHVGTSEGGISDIKVILFIKNRTGKVIEDISVVEKIPHLASIGKEFQVGTLMPSKVMQNPKKGTLVKWDLQTLEAHEERIVTYKIKSKLSILGGLTLPPTIIKYSVRGRESKTTSNSLTLEI
jgi:hypothetical protein